VDGLAFRGALRRGEGGDGWMIPFSGVWAGGLYSRGSRSRRAVCGENAMVYCSGSSLGCGGLIPTNYIA